MRVSLRQPRPNVDVVVVAPALLAPGGPRRTLGTAPAPGAESAPLPVAADQLFGPRGAALDPDDGTLVVCDTGHHRLLIWGGGPTYDGAPADRVIGHESFAREGRNGKRAPDASSLNVPTGVAIGEGVLAVADAWNHRVLLWHGIPTRSNQPADIVLGQADFSGTSANRGARRPAADTLHWCYGVGILAGRLVVADTGNRRVLIWDRVPRRNGAPADRVLGQRDFDRRDENAGEDGGPLGMRWPHAVAKNGERLLVADAGNNRVLIWDRWPTASGTVADRLLGQAGFGALEHNRGHYLPTAASLNMPYGVAADDRAVIVADTANSRLLGWEAGELGFGSAAQTLAAQPDFGAKGDNRWGPPCRDSLCWPYGVTLRGNTAVIADSGNNRVLLWDLAAEARR